MPIPPRKLIAYAAAAGLAAAVIAPQALRNSDDLRIDVTRVNYQVTGSNWPDLWQSIERIGVRPERANAKFEGVTAFNIELQPRDGCSAKNSSINITFVVNQPVLARMSHLDEEGRACWAFYERRLADHEDTHVQMVVHDAKELIQEIRSSGSGSCGDLQGRSQRWFKKMRAAQDRYDIITVGGFKQWKAELDQSSDIKYEALAEHCMKVLEKF
jgi:predicted secreted Zn-dependent protease